MIEKSFNKEIKNTKKAILVVSFGTSYENTRKLTIERIEEKIKEKFSDYDVRRAFTAHRIIKILKERDGIIVPTPEEALETLAREGFDEVVVQPLHIIPGEEYDYVKAVVQNFKDRELFKKIVLGRPAIYFKGEEDSIPDDYTIFTGALRKQISNNQAVVLMGHGTKHPANAVYSCLQEVLRDNELGNAFIGTIDGYPTLDYVIERLKRNNIDEITLMPMLLVAGDHALNDMAGEDDESWKNILIRKGFKVSIYMHGLGENSAFQDIYLNHVKDAIEGRYEGLGCTKKGGK